MKYSLTRHIIFKSQQLVLLGSSKKQYLAFITPNNNFNDDNKRTKSKKEGIIHQSSHGKRVCTPIADKFQQMKSSSVCTLCVATNTATQRLGARARMCVCACTCACVGGDKNVCASPTQSYPYPNTHKARVLVSFDLSPGGACTRAPARLRQSGVFARPSVHITEQRPKHTLVCPRISLAR